MKTCPPIVSEAVREVVLVLAVAALLAWPLPAVIAVAPPVKVALAPLPGAA